MQEHELHNPNLGSKTDSGSKSPKLLLISIKFLYGLHMQWYIDFKKKKEKQVDKSCVNLGKNCIFEKNLSFPIF